jgi:hypothetical protein
MADVPANQTVTIEEGKGIVARQPSRDSGSARPDTLRGRSFNSAA